MAGGIVNIILHATGAGQVVGEVSKSGKVIAELSGNVKKLGNVFGETGSIMSSVLSNIIKGSVWGVMAEGVRLVVHWIGKWRDSAKEAAEETKRKTEEMVAANKKLVASIKEASAAQAAAIDHNLSRREKEIDRVKELTKAEIELARQREIAAAKGDEGKISSANSKAEKLLANVDAEAAAQKIAERMAAAEERVLQRQAAADMAGHAWEEAEAMNQGKRRAYQNAEDEAARKAVQYAEVRLAAIQGENYSGLSDADRAKEEAAARERFANSEEGRALSKDISDHADGALKEAKKALDEANAAVKAAEEARQDASDSAALFLKNREVAVAKAANIESAAARKTAEERQKAELAAAKERARLEQEAHNQRMANIRKELAEQQKAASALSGRAASAASEFDKAFAMYRDPSRAAAEIGEEKDYQSDLDRLHRDARRYGGKWRIDELSSLMAAGDTQGVSDTLKDWRKSRGFTPEVEAMVRASAAENAKTTVEDELRKIEANTAGLGEKLEQLLAIKGGA